MTGSNVNSYSQYMMTLVENFAESLGKPILSEELERVSEYRNSPDYSNSDLKYLHNPKLFKLNKEGLLSSNQTESMIIGQAFEYKFSDHFFGTDFYNQAVAIESSEPAPSSPQQKLFVENILNDMDPVTAYRLCYKTDKKSDDKVYEDAKALMDSLSGFISWSIENKNKIYSLSQQENDAICQMVENAANHPVVQKLMMDNTWNIMNQETISGIEIGGLTWKGRPDLIFWNMDTNESLDRPVINVVLVDIKTTRYMDSFKYDFRNYKYHRQFALYRMLVKKHFHNKFGDLCLVSFLETAAMVAETSFPYSFRYIPIPDKVINVGVSEIKDACNKIMWHTQQNKWENTMSFYINDGREIVEWEKVYKDELAG